MHSTEVQLINQQIVPLKATKYFVVPNVFSLNKKRRKEGFSSVLGL